jgi:short-subunit dehydrogenase
MAGTLAGRRIVLTGASSGIGREAARVLGASGARLALVARRADRLRGLADEVAADGGAEPVILAADLSQPGAAREVAAQANEQLGGVDVLVNNAGASIQALTWVGGDRVEARSVFETNLWAPLALTAELAPQMIERGEGVIVNTGSMVQVSPFPHLGHYSASRAALASLTFTMQLELGPRGVRVVELALGPVDTDASRQNRALQGGAEWLDGRPGIGSMEEAGAALVRAVEGTGRDVVFYPRVMRLVHAVPGLGRRHARTAARRADVTDTALRAGGA